MSVTDHPFRTPAVRFKTSVPGQYRVGAALTNGSDVGEETFSNALHVFEPRSLALDFGA